MKFKGLTPPLYNVFGVLDMNNIVQVMNKMAKQVESTKKNILCPMKSCIKSIKMYPFLIYA